LGLLPLWGKRLLWGNSPIGKKGREILAKPIQPEGFQPEGFQPEGFQPGGFQPEGFQPGGFQTNKAEGPGGQTLAKPMLPPLKQRGPGGFQPGGFQTNKAN
jgi:hypothetical protein